MKRISFVCFSHEAGASSYGLWVWSDGTFTSWGYSDSDGFWVSDALNERPNDYQHTTEYWSMKMGWKVVEL
jgi:hypothetical protein